LALALLNILISSPERLDERLALREECQSLGLAAHIAGLTRAVSKHERMRRAAGGAEEGEGGRGGDAEAEVEKQMGALRRQLDEYAEELSADGELAKAPLDEFRGQCVLLTTSVSVSTKVKDDCRALEALLDGMGVGYTVVDGALRARTRVRNALWEVAGKAIGSSVPKKEYPQLFVDNKYIGGRQQVAHLLESDTVMKTRVQRMAATVADGQAGFDETLRPFMGKPKTGERIVWD